VSVTDLACLCSDPEYQRAGQSWSLFHDLRHAYATIPLVSGKHLKCVLDLLLGGYCCRIAAIGLFGFALAARIPHR
jgi:hypothetical protein